METSKQLGAGLIRARQRSARAGFTLIELLAVMAIILILAGLILSIAGNANYNAAKSRAATEVQAISTACESYKTDNGVYPRITAVQATAKTPTTDTLDARSSWDPAASSSPTYSSTSTTLYQLLSGALYFSAGVPTLAALTPPPAGTAPPTVYYTFLDSQLANTGGVTNGYINPTTVTAFNDPFGYSYGYSTHYQADIDAGVNPPTHGYNPTFDLWSTASYSATAGKTYPTNITQANYSGLWVKNW